MAENPKVKSNHLWLFVFFLIIGSLLITQCSSSAPSNSNRSNSVSDTTQGSTGDLTEYKLFATIEASPCSQFLGHRALRSPTMPFFGIWGP